MQHADQRSSWEAHHSMRAATGVHDTTAEVVTHMQAEVVSKRQLLQQHLLHHLAHLPPGTGPPAAAFRLLQLSSTAPAAALRDLLPCAWQPQQLLQFNPFLSAAAAARLHSALLVWLQLCVLEDKLGRLQQLLLAGPDGVASLIQELQVHRTWEPATHPKWLVFEVEGQLQIRPAQYDIAAHLMENPGAIMQLNMGEGKTRVILPMLALHWADGKRVVRLNFLSSLLHEAYDHLHQHLTASVLGVKLLLLPFHRDVSLTPATARAMRAAVSHCQRVGGLLLVVPEHRMSLELKWHELQLKGGLQDLAVCSELQALAAVPYLDVLDESDELLHHRFQLVYACGNRQQLHARPERVSAIQALLHTLTWLADQGASACPKLHAEGVAVWPPAAERPAGSFCGMQLLSGGPLEAALPGLHSRLAAALLASPPHELRWLSGCHNQEAVLRFITDPSDSCEQLAAAVPGLAPDQADQLLTLRGLLACNMLQHCLQKRHNVDFGINRSPTARKKLAVPYRAARTPSERSEFAQPDVALLLSHISYYNDGLSLPQFEEALHALLAMGDNARRDYYRGWLQLLPADRIAADELSKFDCVDKVDPTNTQQLELMWQHLRHNMAAVDLWLSYCLLPDQTSQFPQRLTRNAWHMADNAAGAVVGFSGTNDNHRLLPLQVQQADAAHKPHLAATNGKMLAMLLQHASYSTLARQDPTQAGKPVWQLLLDHALQYKLHALLDCGALLAGTTNRQAAHYVLQHMDASRYQGVCYFDADSRQWTICDSLGRSLPRQASPVVERDAFVIFDEARCRGADLKLQQQAVGLLTLAPGMGKSQLMQAAGRLRQLGRGQTLQVVGLPDVTEKILAANAAQQHRSSSSAATMQQVLQWVMSNTAQATLHGVTPWASQGLYFISCKASADRALQEDDLLPAALYGSSMAPKPVPDVVAGMVKQHLKAPELQGLQDAVPTAAAAAAATAAAAAAAAAASPGAAAVASQQLQLALLSSRPAGNSNSRPALTASNGSKVAPPAVPVPELVSAHLFNGGSMFDGDLQQLQVLRCMVQRRREAAEALLDSRGRQAQLPRSELELACDEHAAVAKRGSDALLGSAQKRPKGVKSSKG
ncbi:hypothetical protein OEZ85_007879 [Tetradesmus obliquus]|uniref:ubiquitinyl hydrolase 1 n=1 Tax=Tetradesmus obliquus TaxID=3088 RepID=A0ABY8THK5_TETOB|nr:hypothetical protein OEZ85_007879 [Tetradesmus obliquus]